MMNRDEVVWLEHAKMTRDEIVWLEKIFVATVPLLAVLGSCAGVPGGDVFLISYFLLLTGWATFIERTAPNITIDWFSVGVAAVCLVGLAVGLHWFLGWLHREIMQRCQPISEDAESPEPEPETPAIPTWRWRTTLCLLGVVVLMFVSGTAAVGCVHQIVWVKSRA